MEWEWEKELEKLGDGDFGAPLKATEVHARRMAGEVSGLEETPSVWPQNCRCLLNIVENLRQALPVKNVELDPRILDEPAKPAGYA
jgi:hypothetical protein